MKLRSGRQTYYNHSSKSKILLDILKQKHKPAAELIACVEKFADELGKHIKYTRYGLSDDVPPNVATYLSNWKVLELIYDLYVSTKSDKLLLHGCLIVAQLSSHFPEFDQILLKSDKVFALIGAALKTSNKDVLRHAYFALSNLAGTSDVAAKYFKQGTRWRQLVGTYPNYTTPTIATDVVYLYTNMWIGTYDSKLVPTILYYLPKCTQLGVKHACVTLTHPKHRGHLDAPMEADFDKCRRALLKNIQANRPLR